MNNQYLQFVREQLIIATAEAAHEKRESVSR